VDTNDSATAARSFLARHPLSYPSYESSAAELAPLAPLAAIDGMPSTIFINRARKVVSVHLAQYESEFALQNDIEHYALGVAG
jgi:hypothetical protein